MYLVHLKFIHASPLFARAYICIHELPRVHIHLTDAPLGTLRYLRRHVTIFYIEIISNEQHKCEHTILSSSLFCCCSSVGIQLKPGRKRASLVTVGGHHRVCGVCVGSRIGNLFLNE